MADHNSRIGLDSAPKRPAMCQQMRRLDPEKTMIDQKKKIKFSTKIKMTMARKQKAWGMTPTGRVRPGWTGVGLAWRKCPEVETGPEYLCKRGQEKEAGWLESRIQRCC